MPGLHDWQNFYMLTGTAAATLIGLLFIAVSISIGIHFTAKQIRTSFHTFVNPTLIYYLQALFISCLALTPLESPSIAGGLLIVLGSINIVLAWKVCWRILVLHRDNGMDFDDWLWHVVLPLSAGVLCVCTAIGFLVSTPLAPTGLCITDLLCLTTGLHNTWALTIWLVVRQGQKDDVSQEEEAQEADAASSLR